MHCWQLPGNIEVGHLKPLVTGLALAEVLDLLFNERDPHLTSCPKTGATSPEPLETS